MEFDCLVVTANGWHDAVTSERKLLANFSLTVPALGSVQTAPYPTSTWFASAHCHGGWAECFFTVACAAVAGEAAAPTAVALPSTLRGVLAPANVTVSRVALLANGSVRLTLSTTRAAAFVFASSTLPGVFQPDNGFLLLPEVPRDLVFEPRVGLDPAVTSVTAFAASLTIYSANDFAPVQQPAV